MSETNKLSGEITESPQWDSCPPTRPYPDGSAQTTLYGLIVNLEIKSLIGSHLFTFRFRRNRRGAAENEKFARQVRPRLNA